MACQGPPSMGFSWGGLPCPHPGGLLGPGLEPEALKSPALAGGLSATSTTWEALKIGTFICKEQRPASPSTRNRGVILRLHTSTCILVEAIQPDFRKLGRAAPVDQLIAFTFWKQTNKRISTLKLCCSIELATCLLHIIIF